MVFHSNVRYEDGNIKFEELSEGVWAIRHTGTPVYSYFDPKKSPAVPAAESSAPDCQSPEDMEETA